MGPTDGRTNGRIAASLNAPPLRRGHNNTQTVLFYPQSNGFFQKKISLEDFYGNLL